MIACKPAVALQCASAGQDSVRASRSYNISCSGIAYKAPRPLAGIC